MVFVGLFVYEYINYNNILVKDLSAKADLLAENMDAALAFHDSSDVSHVLQSLASQQQITAAAVYDLNEISLPSICAGVNRQFFP